MRALLFVMSATLLIACGGDGKTPVTPVPSTPAAVIVQAGDAQTVASGEVAPIAPSVLVRDAQRRPIAGVVVTFAVAEGGGALEGATPTTDASGVAVVTRWTLGTVGPQRITATVGNVAPISIVATIRAGTQALTTVVPATGGRVEITESGHPYRGLRLTLPPGTFAGAATWGLRLVQNALPPVMPAGYRVVGPALEISSELSRGSKLMTLEVPVRRTTNTDVVLVFFDPARRVLEVLPTVARTDSSIRVASAHFRADLLLGRRTPASREAVAAVRVSGRAPAPGLLFPIEFPVPMPVVPTLGNLERIRWPVVDYGSPPFPNAFGLEITSLQIMASKSGATLSFGSLFKGVQTPGFYADGAPLGVLTAMTTARTTVNQGLSALQEIRFADKATGDQTFQHLLTAQIALTGEPAMASVFPAASFGRVDQTAFVLGVGSPENTLTLASPASPGTVDLFRLGSGFQETTVQNVGGSPGILVNSLLPITSFVLPFEQYDVPFGDLLTLEGKSGAARQAINKAVAAKAGLPTPKLEYEGVLGGGWIPFDSATTVIRTNTARVRIAEFAGYGGAGTAAVLNFGGSGAELTRARSNVMSFGELPAVSALPELQFTDLVFSAAKEKSLSQLLIPVMPVTATVTRSIFRVTPDTATISGDSLRVSFDAPVRLPPDISFRIRWDWGDGTTSETVGQTTATHTYGAAGSFGVVTTLLTPDARATVAIDTVMVKSRGEERNWIISSIADRDSLFQFGDPSDDSPTVALLKRMLAAPRSALITVDSTASSTTLRLRVLPTSLWQPATCCGAVQPGEMRQTLGVAPTVQYVVGPYFAGWDTDRWAQSTANLGAGIMTGQSILNLAQFNVENGGVQTGPAGGFRFSATRNGTAMSGTILLWIWYFDSEEGSEMYVNDAPTLYRFPFTATRTR